jgi:hypothetical protein
MSLNKPITLKDFKPKIILMKSTIIQIIEVIAEIEIIKIPTLIMPRKKSLLNFPQITIIQIILKSTKNNNPTLSKIILILIILIKTKVLPFPLNSTYLIITINKISIPIKSTLIDSIFYKIPILNKLIKNLKSKKLNK